ncbi:helicase RepA family protein [Muricoccus vinaceus]|uniref:Helicase RepA family protein n=1 Tax=Muricoccus vinaceus TaxID=424704 RepID=A0ABV6IL63_9PROT
MSADPLDAYAALRARAAQASGLHVVHDASPLTIKPASLRRGAAIPPREWLYGYQLVRRYITVLVAPGGVGKTSYSVVVALSVAGGKGLMGDWVHAQANTLCCGLEDPEDEFDRRVAAAMDHYNLDDEHLAGRLFIISGRERRLVIAALDADGMSIAYPDKDALVRLIRENNIGFLVVDPFVNSHELEENSNPHINAAARAWAEVADATGCAILLVHHTRKGAIAGDADGARGASALIGAARAAMTLTSMSPEEAESFDIREDARRLYVRLDDAKSNLAPPAGKARWFHLASVALGNETPAYPKGDNVQVIEAWEPPDVWKELSVADLNAILDRIAAGNGQGQRFSGSRRGRSNTRWAGNVVMEMFDVEEGQAGKVINAWLKSGLLVEGEYSDPVTRKKAQGVTVDHSKRPG